MKAAPIVLAIATTLGACEAPAMADLKIPGATPTSYAALRDASGAVGFAETALPKSLARGGYSAHPGGSPVAPDRVAGAWQLPDDADLTALPRTLEGIGQVDRAQLWRDGQLWTGELKAAGTTLMLLAIDGTHPRFARDQRPELRPAAHKYLIAYRMG